MFFLQFSCQLNALVIMMRKFEMKGLCKLLQIMTDSLFCFTESRFSCSVKMSRHCVIFTKMQNEKSKTKCKIWNVLLYI